MKRILVTGATGNVGTAVINSLYPFREKLQVFAGLRKFTASEGSANAGYALPVYFDFEDSASYAPALSNCDVLFLLRPPQLSDVNKIFKPLITLASSAGVQHVVFLSVQGAEQNSFIPHHKIEHLIRQSGIPFTFLRPAYFMQNFTTTLLKELTGKKRIYLPAGDARFTLVDVGDVGKMAAVILVNPVKYNNKAFDITSADLLSFAEMAAILSRVLQTNIDYQSPSLIAFFRQKRREHVPVVFILVMIMLHYFPRFQKAPVISNAFAEITGERAVSFEAFAAANKAQLTA